MHFCADELAAMVAAVGFVGVARDHVVMVTRRVVEWVRLRRRP